MSEHNYAGLLFKHNLEKHPEVFIINEETCKQVEEMGKKTRAARDAAAPPPGKEDLQKEYNQLRQKLFDLKQDAKCFEIRTNDAAGRIRLLEQRIDDALREKKAASAANNLRGERTYERIVASLEIELADAKEDYEKNRNWNTRAARALKEFNGHERIAELKAELEAPKIISK